MMQQLKPQSVLKCFLKIEQKCFQDLNAGLSKKFLLRIGTAVSISMTEDSKTVHSYLTINKQ
jgi:hypothetical protein